MQAFGPYKNLSTIDFSLFEEQSLFLLTGDTGSGKTMIFDALTFALFGQTSGNERSANSLRSQFASPYDETFVELSFKHQNKEYTIRRNPTHSYAKKQGGKETNTLHQAELKADDTIYSGVSVVNEKIENLLGLSYDQFKQIALIGQGEFRKLLTAKSDARSEIFRKIFNTKLYQDFEYKLRTMNSEAKKYYDEELLLIQNILENLEDIEITNLSIDSLDENINQIDTYIHEKEAVSNTLIKKTKDLETEILSLSKQLEKEKAIQDNFKRLENIQNEEKVLLEREEKFKSLEKTIKQVKDVKLYIEPIHNKLKETQARMTQITQVINSNHQEKEVLEKQKLHLDEELTSLYSQKDAMEKLKQEVHQLKNTLSKYQEMDSLAKNLEDIKLNLAKTAQSKSTTQNTIEKLTGKKKKLEENLLLQAELKIKQTSLKTKLEQLTQLKDLHQQTQKYEKEHQDVLHKYEIVVLELKKKKDLFASLEETFYLSQAGILASLLIDDEPCAVCGSKEHPSPAKLINEDITKEALDTAKKAVEIIEEARSKTQASLSKLSGKLQESEKQYQSLYQNYQNQDIDRLYEKTSLEATTVQENLKALEDSAKELNNIETSLSQESKNIEHLTEKIQALTVKKAQDETSLFKLQETLLFESYELANNTYLKHQKTLTEYEKNLEAVQMKMTTSNERMASLKGATKTLSLELNTHSETQESLQESFKTSLEKYKVEDFEKLLQMSDEVDQLEESLEIYKRKRHENSILILELQKGLKDTIMPDTSLTQAAIENAQSELKLIQETQQEVHTQISKQKSNLVRLKSHQKSYQKRLESYQEINVLYRTASGNLSQKDKISFEYYVQTAYFTKVIEEANKRLDVMTQSRYALKLRTQASDKRSVSGLDLDVMDFHSNKVREVSTLSGGESFKAALSLALGMSDVIQIFAGGIEIDMLFVDEGFGSLDQQSLDQAMQVLTSLSTSNRMIGIISHVSELKQRVEQQIVVNKTVNGSTITQIA